MDIETPSFNQTSYIAVDVQMNPSRMWVELTFNPYSPNGHLFYAGNSTLQTDYLSVALVQGRLQVRYDLGSGSVVLESDLLELNVWHTVFLTRRGREMSLRVDSEHYGAVMSPGSFSELNVGSRVDVGGVADYSIVSFASAGSIPGFTGCIRSLVVRHTHTHQYNHTPIHTYKYTHIS